MKKRKIKIDIKILLIVLLSIINIAFIELTFKNSDIKLFNVVKEKILTFQRREIFEQINPSKGYELGVKFGNLGPKMLKIGVIDFDKFKNIYDERSPLTDEQIKILKKGSKEEIK